MSYEERCGQYDCGLCDARIWAEKPQSGGLGYDNIQCSYKKVDGCECLCKYHFKKQNEGELWTGLITEPRPEFPEVVVLLDAGKPALKEWSTDKEGNDIVKEEKSKKYSVEELEALLAKEKKEEKEKERAKLAEKYKKYSVEELEALLAKAKKKEEKEKERAKLAEKAAEDAACIMGLTALLAKEEKKAGDAIRMFGELQVKFNLLEEELEAAMAERESSDDEDQLVLIMNDGSSLTLKVNSHSRR
jgi:hypothetical protein